MRLRPGCLTPPIRAVKLIRPLENSRIVTEEPQIILDEGMEVDYVLWNMLEVPDEVCGSLQDIPVSLEFERQSEMDAVKPGSMEVEHSRPIKRHMSSVSDIEDIVSKRKRQESLAVNLVELIGKLVEFVGV